MEFKISKELFDSNAQEEQSNIGESIKTSTSCTKASSAATVMKLTVERDPSKLEFAKNMLFFIGLINYTLLAMLFMIFCTGLDSVHLLHTRKFLFHKLLSAEYLAIVYQVRFLPIFVGFFTLC